MMNKTDSISTFGKLVFGVGQAMEWTVERLDALMGAMWGCVAGACNPVREGRHFLKEKAIQAQSYRRSKR